MAFLISKRFLLTLLLLACASGCSFTKTTPSGALDITSSPNATDVALSQPINKCKGHLDACKYEGSYERGEANYAEQEAKRLNRIALQKFRDSIQQP